MPDLREKYVTTQPFNDRPKAEAPITEVNV
jgi:hypothetical protein